MDDKEFFEQIDLTGSDKERLNLIRAELLSLSEKFGPIKRRIDGTLISNDEDFAELIPSLRKKFKSKERSGIGFFIGSGGALSLLPELPINIPLVVDSNKAVLELSELLSRLIAEEESPKAVLTKIKSIEIRGRYSIINDIMSKYGNLDRIDGFLKKEGRQYGVYHWTDPQRFFIAQTALRERPLVHVAADITNSEFATAFAEISRKSGQLITFANLTNIHSWLKPQNMGFLRNFLIATDAPIVFASDKGLLLGDWPKARIAESLEQYIQESNSEED